MASPVLGTGARDHLVGDASKARAELDSEPRVSFEQLVRMMVDADVERLSGLATQVERTPLTQMALLAALSRRLRGGRGENEAEPPNPAYGANWVPQDETEAMAQILNVSDPEAFEAAGRHDAEKLRGHIDTTDTVLDLGCGIGRVTRYVAPLCREVWAVDASETMLRLGRERLAEVPNVRFLLGRGTSLPELDSGSIDFAYSLLTLQHIEREHAFRLLRELRRVLRDGGQAYLTFPNLLSDEYLRAFLHYVDIDEVGNPARARFYTPEEVGRLLPAAGFEILQIDPGTEIVVTCETA